MSIAQQQTLCLRASLRQALSHDRSKVNRQSAMEARNRAQVGREMPKAAEACPIALIETQNCYNVRRKVFEFGIVR